MIPIVWTSAEEKLLKEIYGTKPREYILSKINRPWKSIRGRAVKLGIERDKDLIKKERNENNKKTSLERYGTATPLQTDAVKEKIKKSNLEKYGAEYHTQTQAGKDKVRQAVREKYGVDNVFQTEEVKEKIKETTLERYGVAHHNQCQEVRQKTIATNLEKYGVENTFQLTDRVEEGMLKKYGHKYSAHVPEIQQRKEQTNIKKYGHKSPAGNPAIRQKSLNTNMQRYGTQFPQKITEIKKKIVKTNITKYGVDNPAKSSEVKEKIKQTCIKRYGVEYSLQSSEVREKGYETSKKNNSFSKSKEEESFLKYLKIFDDKLIPHVKHPVLGHNIDYYLPTLDLWVQYDGVYWHGKEKRKNLSKRARKIEKTVVRDELQNKTIKNLIRFWSDEVEIAVSNETIFDLIKEKIKSKIPEFNKEICHQVIKKIECSEEDLKNLPFDHKNLSPTSFDLAFESLNPEIREFIVKYEWLESSGVNPKWCFTARYKNFLAGVVLVNEPTSYSKLLGEKTTIYEALIQRGATASWTPKNLGSKMVMFACNWMVKNTLKRAFVAYADPAAHEVGTIYQACNFEYLGQDFGNIYLYKHPEIKNGQMFSSQTLRRTSTFKKWCRMNGIEIKDKWIKGSGFKDLSVIPNAVQDKYRNWIRRILSESEREKVERKHKYILVLGNNKTDQRNLNILKEYKSIPYPKRT